jgi:hypothetical protein
MITGKADGISVYSNPRGVRINPMHIPRRINIITAMGASRSPKVILTLKYSKIAKITNDLIRNLYNVL